MKWILFSLILSGSPAWAFDRLKCDSNLLGWSVHNNPNAKQVLLNKKNKSTYLARIESNELFIKNEKGLPMASITPWNSVLFLKSKSATKGKYKMDFSTDNSTYFSLSVANADGSKKQDLRCQFTF